MTKFLLLRDEGNEPILVNLDHVIAIRCCNHDHSDDNARIDFVVRDWEVCSNHGIVERSKRVCDTEPTLWWNEFSTLMMGRCETAKAALLEALETPGIVVDLGAIADKHGERWCEENIPKP